MTPKAKGLKTLLDSTGGAVQAEIEDGTVKGRAVVPGGTGGGDGESQIEGEEGLATGNLAGKEVEAASKEEAIEEPGGTGEGLSAKLVSGRFQSGGGDGCGGRLEFSQAGGYEER